MPVLLCSVWIASSSAVTVRSKSAIMTSIWATRMADALLKERHHFLLEVFIKTRNRRHVMTRDQAELVLRMSSRVRR
jgi:hypothetical protein